MSNERLAAAPALLEGPWDGRDVFASHVRAALASASAQGWRELIFCDADFADWPLGDEASAAALQTWAAPGRRFVLLAQRFDVLERGAHARFTHWRRMWSHIIDCRVCLGPNKPGVPSAIWTPSWMLHRVDAERSRGVCGGDGASRRALRERIDECLRQGRPGFPASTLGL